MAKSNPPKTLRNLKLFSDRAFKVLTFVQLAKKYGISHTTAHELYHKTRKRYFDLNEGQVKDLIDNFSKSESEKSIGDKTRESEC